MSMPPDAPVPSPVGPPAPPVGTYPSTPQPTPPAPRRRRRGLWLGLFIAFIALSGVVLLGYVGNRIGPVALGVGIAAAMLPVPVLVSCFLWLDRYEPEPVSLLLFCFLWGAFVATGVALIVNTTAGNLFERWHISDDLVGVVVAPVIEESMKALFPILLFIFARRRFSGITDGIVFCGLSATGFAMVENILYLGGYGYASGAAENGFAGGALAVEAMFIGRVLFTGFGHPLFTSMTGIGLGIAARSADKRVRVLAPCVGLLLAMCLHAGWNFMASFAQDNPYYVLYGYFAVFMPIFLAVVGVVIWVRSWEGRLTERILPAYAATGWFSPPEVLALGTLGRRLSARAWARRVAGDAGAAAMRNYQYAATRLALLRDGLDRGLRAQPADVAAAVHEEQQLLTAVDAYRSVFTRRDPVTPPARWDGQRYHVVFPDGVTRPVEAPPLPVVPVPYVAQ